MGVNSRTTRTTQVLRRDQAVNLDSEHRHSCLGAERGLADHTRICVL